MSVAVSVWEDLGIEPTSDLRTLRAAYEGLRDRLSPETDSESSLRLRFAYETASLWCAVGLPPLASLGSGPVEVLESFATLATRYDPQAPFHQFYRAGAEAIRLLLDSSRFSGAVRDGIQSCHDEVETLATSVERGDATEEQTRALLELLRHPALANHEVSREVELILPFLLARSRASLETVDLAIRHFGWRRRALKTSALHAMFVSDVLVAVAGAELLSRFREEASGWLRSWPREISPLVCEVLTGAYRPSLFLYARCIEPVWFLLQQKWNELTSLPDWYLLLALDPRTHQYWRARMSEPPSRLVSLARSLQIPVLLAGALVGIGIAVSILAPQPAGSAWTFVLGFMTIPFVVWSTTLGAHLLFFGLLWVAARRSGEC